MKNHTHVKKLEHTLGFSLLGGDGESPIPPPHQPKICSSLPPRKIPLPQKSIPPLPPLNNFQVITQQKQHFWL